MEKTMKNILVCTVTLFLAIAGSAAGSEVSWSYSGETGPRAWGDLDPSFTACSRGVNQSPVDLTGFVDAELAPLAFKYTGLARGIANNGHTVEVRHTSGSLLKVGETVYELKQFHFHAPSEHLFNGEPFPMEVHFVHQAKSGALAVIGVLFREGKENPALARLWRQMPAKAGDETGLASQVKAEELLPDSREYYRYNGSLTTPPCSEGVLWLVMKEVVEVSSRQVEQFRQVMGEGNNRPVQPLAARAILQ